MREVFFIIGKQDVVLWSDASTSPVLLPDSRARWEAIWKRRKRIVEIAHSHPVGPLAFSMTDETTMTALESGLGKKIVWSVVAPTGMVRRNEEGKDVIVEREPWWAMLLRLSSGMNRKEK
jgi:hypothetical protein